MILFIDNCIFYHSPSNIPLKIILKTIIIIDIWLLEKPYIYDEARTLLMHPC